MKRREFLKLSVAATAIAALSRQGRAQTAVTEIRIGYQKNGVLVIARQQVTLEKHFASRGIAVKWVEVSSGPPMLEAMNVGSIDYGAVGDSPPVFAQSAGAAIVYAAGQPVTNGQGILVRGNSAIRGIADLKGKRVGFTKGSSAHNIVVQTLEKAGLTYADITPVYLTPPDAGPAFANGSIDAWAIWDPYFAIGETRQQGRILVNASDITTTNSFYFVLYRQPRFCEEPWSGPAANHRRHGLDRQVGRSAPRRSGEIAERHHRDSLGYPDRCRQPLVLCRRPDHRRYRCHPARCGRSLLQVGSDSETGRGSRRGVEAGADLS
jgi:ABC-type nitrate/sulfonate/bicarbonate transport system substrate-binding protein